jgi:predicted Zn-ribbon and HTH transcriptional regulator
VVLPEPDGSTTVLEGPLLHEGREIGEITNEVDAWSEPLVRQAIADALAKQVTRAPIAETAHNIKGQHMNKLEEMWAALAAYQSKADAAGHGATWAAMCKERTAEAAVAASNAAAYTAYAAAKAAAVASAVNATADAAAASAAASAAADADAADADADAKAAADAEKWARIAIERINKVLAAQPAQPLTKEQVQPAQGELEDLLDMYWDLAYAEGHSHGKESYGTKANETRHKIRALLQSSAERVPLEPVNCDTCRYHYKDLYQKPCNTCIHSGDFGSNFEPRFEIKKGQQ